MIENLCKEVARVTRLTAERGLLCSSDGNLSARTNDGRILITPSGVYKATLAPQDIITIDLEGNVLEARDGLRPTSETLMHLEVYRQRPDVRAVLHAHPPYATALTIAGQPFPVDMIPEVLFMLGDVPTAEYATPGTIDLAHSIRDLIRAHNCVLLSHHGSLNVGQTLEEALVALERLEHAAKVFCIAQNLGAVSRLPAEELAKLRAASPALKSVAEH
jgi:L-fuculose-phosphate aldolase